MRETDAVEHSIDTFTAKPVKQPPRRLPYALRKQLEDELDKLLKINGNEPASSCYASPLVLVRKPDGNLRICMRIKQNCEVIIKLRWLKSQKKKQHLYVIVVYISIVKCRLD